MTSVAKRFRDPTNTDEEIKKMEAKRKRLDKKELKIKQAEAHAINIQYLVDTLESGTPSTSTKSNESECIETVDDAKAKVEQDMRIGQVNDFNILKHTKKDGKKRKELKARTNTKSRKNNLNKVQLQQPSTSFACNTVVQEIITSVGDVGLEKESRSYVDQDKSKWQPSDEDNIDDKNETSSVQTEGSIVMITDFVDEMHLDPPFNSDLDKVTATDEDQSFPGEMV